jgi:hypothetical protein
MGERILSQEEQDLTEALRATLSNEGENMDVKDIVICVAHFLGTIITHMDMRRWSSEQVMQLIADNIEAGNQQMLQAQLQHQGKPS